MSDALVVQLQADIANFRAGMDSAVASLQKIQDSAKRTSSATQSMARQMQAVGLAVKGFIAAQVLQGINKLKDSFVELAEAPQNFRASLEALTGSASRANDLLNDMYDVASKTGVGFKDAAALAQRFTIGLKEMGANNAQITQMTETVIKLGRIGGSSIAETTGAAFQLSQALASGKLQGDEPVSYTHLTLPTICSV